ncbi:MAG TPA: hypothetical protein VFM82_04475, partial [Flavobacteriaceae bacterium]|nr:hypothetical protein [Flavobacteriaceae bacterium]
MDFFSEFGHDDRNRGDFTNRLKFAESKLKLSNNTPTLANIIEGSLHLREFFASKINRDDSVRIINEQLRKDGFELYKINDQYKIAHTNGRMLEKRNNLNREFIKNHVNTCNKYLEENQFIKAKEEAKNMLISVMCALLEDIEGEKVENDKSMEELYTAVKKAMKINVVEPRTSPLSIVQILSGFESIIEGISRLTHDSESHF